MGDHSGKRFILGLKFPLLSLSQCKPQGMFYSSMCCMPAGPLCPHGLLYKSKWSMPSPSKLRLKSISE